VNSHREEVSLVVVEAVPPRDPPTPAAGWPAAPGRLGAWAWARAAAILSAVSLGSAGCAQQSQDPSTEALALWQTDRSAAVELVAGHQDPVVQRALVNLLIEAYPEDLELLCGALPAGGGKERCAALSRRPHLVEVPQGSIDKVPDVVGLASLAFPYRGLAEELPQDPQEDPQVQPDIARAASDADVGEIVAACEPLRSELLRSECYFLAAEKILRPAQRAQPERLPLAMEFCLGTGSYRVRCAGNLARAVGSGAPSADAADSEGWAAIAAAIRATEARFAALDAEVAARLADWLWAEVVWSSYARAEQLTGNPADHLPQAGLPHLRASAAWWAAKHWSERPPGLDAWGLALQAALQRRGSATHERGPSRAGPGVGVQTPGAPLPAGLRSAFFLGAARRPVLDDAAADLLACVLELAARRGDWELVRQGAAHEDEGLRRVAERLLPSDPVQPGPKVEPARQAAGEGRQRR